MRVLVVEDEQQVREEFIEFLELRGFDVTAACGVSSAFARVKDLKEPTILLTDLRLPDGSGLDIIRAIQRDHELGAMIVRTIVMTGHTDITEQLERAVDGQTVTTLFKPLDLMRLLTLLAEPVT